MPILADFMKEALEPTRWMAMCDPAPSEGGITSALAWIASSMGRGVEARPLHLHHADH